jgi:galactose mutarotase-like enzyme
VALVNVGSGQLSVAVNTLGAELFSIKTPDGAEWLWQGDAKYWNGRAPILFPVVGRTPDGYVTVNGTEYPIGNHGFARTSTFDVVEQSEGRVRLRIADNPETRVSFPFAFRLDLVFSVEGAALTTRAEVTNTGTVTMPFSFGYHPAFHWPLPGGASKTYWLTLPDGEEPPTMRLGEKLVLAPKSEPSMFSKGRYQPRAGDFVRDAIIIEKIAGSSIVFGVDGGPGVTVGWQGLDSLGIWQKPGAPYLCIEPWQGLPPWVGGSVELEDRPGSVTLAPGAMRAFTMTITPRRA